MITGAPANILAFGADPTGVASSDAALTEAQAVCGSTVELIWPSGTYKLTQPVTQSGYWIADGEVTLSFSGIAAGSDCLTISGGAGYNKTVTDGFVVDCNASGRDGVVLLNGNNPRVNVKVLNAQRDGFAVFCGGFDWVENAELDITTEANGRHGCRLEMYGANGAFFNESILKLEVRGVASRYTGGTGLLGYCPATNAGSKISAIHIQRINLDAQRAASVAAGFDIGQNPINLAYAAGGTNRFESWIIEGGGFETTTGSDDYRSAYLIKAVR